MAFIIASNFVADIAFWAGFSLFATAIFCILFMLYFRNITFAAKQKGELVEQEWEKILFDNLTSESVKPVKLWSPKSKKSKKKAKNKEFSSEHNKKKKTQTYRKLASKELPSFLYIWNYVHVSLRGESKKSLNIFGQKLDLEENCLQMLKSWHVKKRLLAIETLGNLRSEKAVPYLKEFTAHKDSVISFSAVRSLLRIDFEANSKEFLPLIAVREDWSPPIVAETLKQHGADVISTTLINLVEESYNQRRNDRQLSRLISYLSLAHPIEYEKLVNKIFTESNKTEVIIACLRLINSDDMLPKVRGLLKDERWQIRLHVVMALGRLGNDEDVGRLIFSLNDLDWWVRYRSACALSSMPTVTTEQLEELSKTLPNQFSRDILNHVLAEIRLGCLIQPSSFTLSK